MLPVLRGNGWPATRFEDLARFGGELHGLCKGILGRDGATVTAEATGVWEDEDRIVVELDLPGVAESDVDITIPNAMLQFRGQRQPVAGRRYLIDN